jgi:hypothetical protein
VAAAPHRDVQVARFTFFKFTLGVTKRFSADRYSAGKASAAIDVVASDDLVASYFWSLRLTLTVTVTGSLTRRFEVSGFRLGVSEST